MEIKLQIENGNEWLNEYVGVFVENGGRFEGARGENLEGGGHVKNILPIIHTVSQQIESFVRRLNPLLSIHTLVLVVRRVVLATLQLFFDLLRLIVFAIYNKDEQCSSQRKYFLPDVCRECHVVERMVGIGLQTRPLSSRMIVLIKQPKIYMILNTG